MSKCQDVNVAATDGACPRIKVANKSGAAFVGVAGEVFELGGVESLSLARSLAGSSVSLVQSASRPVSSCSRDRDASKSTQRNSRGSVWLRAANRAAARYEDSDSEPMSALFYK